MVNYLFKPHHSRKHQTPPIRWELCQSSILLSSLLAHSNLTHTHPRQRHEERAV
jgi:hypothetical protein